MFSNARRPQFEGPPIHPFASATFRLLWCSTLASSAAQLMERVVTGWLALEAGGGALGVGIVIAARTLPGFLFGLPAGALADRGDRRRILLGVSLAGAVLTGGLGLLVRDGSVALWQVAAIAFLAGTIQVSDQPARQALVYDAVGRASAPRAIAQNAVASRLSGAVGAFAGGLIIPAFGVANTYFAVAATYLLALVLIGFLRAPASGHRSAALPAFGRALADAGRLILDRPAVRTLVLAAMACEVFAFSYMTAVPTIARDVLHAGAEGLGTLTAASSIGATVAVVILASLPGSVRREPLLTGVYVLYGVAILAFALTTSLVLATAVILVIGACGSAFDTLQQTMIQLAVPEDQRGRAVGIWAFSIGTAPIGHLEIGALAAALGAPVALLANGVGVMAGALLLVLWSPEFRLGRKRGALVPKSAVDGDS